MYCLLGVILLASGSNNEVMLDDPRLKISFRSDVSIFPPSWQNFEIQPLAQTIAEENQGACVEVLRRAFAKYPSRLVEKNLKSVFVSRALKFYGLEYGGTNSLDALYLTLLPAGGNTLNYEFLERAMHHEFSSILLRNHEPIFPTSAWIAVNPPDFKYRGDGTQSLREGTASTKYDSESNQRGFLAEYSTSSLEEDFNLYAEAIFSGDRSFWRIYDTYPAVTRKADLAISFYTRLDPSLTKKTLTRFARAQLQ